MAMKHRLRQTLTLANLAFAVGLIFLLFVMVNYLAARHYRQFDLTSARMYTLSDKTEAVMENLAQEVKITVFYQPGHPLYDPLKQLLDRYKRLSRSLSVEFVDPDRDVARAEALAQQFGVETGNIVIFESGDSHKYISDEDLADIDNSGVLEGLPSILTAFKGEGAITAGILEVTEAKRPVVAFVTGHGEKSTASFEKDGISGLKILLERDNMEVRDISLLAFESLQPEEIDVLAVAGPRARFAPEEIDLIQDYLLRGGSLFLLLDPLVEVGLEDFLESYGIRVTQDVVVDPARKLPMVSAANLFIAEYLTHPITAPIQGLTLLMPLTRSVEPIRGVLDNFNVQSLAKTSPQGWGEMTPHNPKFTFNDGEDVEGPVSVAVAAEWTGEGGRRSRLVVLGDSDLVDNTQVNNLGNGQFFLAGTNWLAERESLIQIGPKQAENIRLTLEAKELHQIFWGTVVGMPALGLLLGGAVWWRRRR
ncbi:MAG: GldG family protein [Candidatus Omnitrophica bacterium]|nr:GldG family protein [Candidatus Omnitrophota bacterium]